MNRSLSRFYSYQKDRASYIQLSCSTELFYYGCQVSVIINIKSNCNYVNTMQVYANMSSALKLGFGISYKCATDSLQC